VTISIAELELVASAGWRAPDADRLGDWLLRAAGGFTGRANSALAVGDPGLPLTAAIGRVLDWYCERRLPAMIAVPFPVQRPDESTLDRMLADAGWTPRPGTATVMTALAEEVADRAGRSAAAVDIDAEPDEAWLARYHYRGQALPPVALQLLKSAPWQAFGSVRTDGQTIAIGRVAASGDWAGLTAVEVDPARRRQGLATTVTAALASAATAHGARQIYLQVEDGNAAARALYHRLGFTDHHGYHYRRAPAAD
jgi:ribosomal protein S18 acetylase RimI-like enzyme